MRLSLIVLAVSILAAITYGVYRMAVKSGSGGGKTNNSTNPNPGNPDTGKPTTGTGGGIVPVGDGLMFYAAVSPITSLYAAAQAAVSMKMGLAATPAAWKGVTAAAWTATGIVGGKGDETATVGVLLDPKTAPPYQTFLHPYYKNDFLGPLYVDPADLADPKKIAVQTNAPGTNFFAVQVGPKENHTKIYIVPTGEALYVDSTTTKMPTLRARGPEQGPGDPFYVFNDDMKMKWGKILLRAGNYDEYSFKRYFQFGGSDKDSSVISMKEA